MHATRLWIAAALTALAFGAHAEQGEISPIPPQKFESTRSRLAVRTEALTPLQIGNGGSGVQAVPPSTVDRAAVRASAAAAVRANTISYGEKSGGAM